MNNIKTILVDDEPRSLSSLQKLLEFNCPEVEVIDRCIDAAAAYSSIKALQPQLVFLDIAMPGVNGFDLLHKLGSTNFEIIFVTAHSSFMIQAFRFSAVDYLLKPVDESLLAEAVKRAALKIDSKNSGQTVTTFLHNLQQKAGSQKMKLCIPSLKGFQVVEIQDIIYCEASSNYTNFYFANRPVICASKLIHEYEELLEDCGFIRTHKSYLVNLEHIKEYIRGEGGSIILTNDHEIEVSRRKKDILMTRIKEYYKY